MSKLRGWLLDGLKDLLAWAVLSIPIWVLAAILAYLETHGYISHYPK